MDRQVMIVIFVLLIIATLFYSSSQRYTQGRVVSGSSNAIISTPNAYDKSAMPSYNQPREYRDSDEPSQQYPSEIQNKETPILDAAFIQSNPVDCKKLPKEMRM